MPQAETIRQARAVLLPAIDDLTLTPALREHLQAGGRSILLAETREEYVARAMSPERIAAETADDVRAITAETRSLAGAPVLVAADFEPGGIQRFASLVPPLPARELLERDEVDLEALAEASARAAAGLRELGVNLVLAPIVDSLDAPNGWLDRRHFGPGTDRPAELAAAFIEAFEAAGVATTVKHFPGHRGLTTDPAVDDEALVPADAATRSPEELQRLLDLGLAAFRRTLPAASCTMIGPGTIAALDPDRSAVLSPTVIGQLEAELGWTGLIISDGLEMAAIVADGKQPHEAAVEALAAGNDLLLIGAAQVDAAAHALAAAVDDGRLPASRLAEAAANVAGLADRVG